MTDFEPTMRLRWKIVDYDHEKILQQEWRKYKPTYGTEAHHDYEWRDVETVGDGG